MQKVSFKSFDARDCGDITKRGFTETSNHLPCQHYESLYPIINSDCHIFFTIEKVLELQDELHLLEAAAHCEVVVLGAERLHNVHIDLAHFSSQIRSSVPDQVTDQISDHKS